VVEEEKPVEVNKTEEPVKDAPKKDNTPPKEDVEQPSGSK
jgi:hypothetical protein